MGNVQLFVEKRHTDTVLASRVVHILNDNAMTHFRKKIAMQTKNTHIGLVVG